MHKSRALLSALAFVLSLSLVSIASAQRVSKAKGGASKAKAAKVTKWKANGTEFMHRTHGKSSIGWERHATGKDGVTKISGKLWGSKIKGQSATLGGKTLSVVTATAPSGDTRITTTFTKGKGKSFREYKKIDMKPAGITRKITTWRMGNTKMTATRDYNSASGKLIKRFRTGVKATE